MLLDQGSGILAQRHKPTLAGQGLVSEGLLQAKVFRCLILMVDLCMTKPMAGCRGFSQIRLKGH